MYLKQLMVVVGLMLASSLAFAEDAPYMFGAQTETYVLAGLTAGGSFGALGGGGFAGGELSLARQRHLWWHGVYVDGAYDFGHDAAMFTAGPEFGWGPLGIDGGGALRLGVEDEAELGVQGRVFLTFGVFAVFARTSFWPETTNDRVSQFGVLLKLPLWNSTPTPADAR